MGDLMELGITNGEHRKVILAQIANNIKLHRVSSLNEGVHGDKMPVLPDEETELTDGENDELFVDKKQHITTKGVEKEENLNILDEDEDEEDEQEMYKKGGGNTKKGGGDDVDDELYKK